MLLKHFQLQEVLTSLTMEELEDIRDECFAADVDIDFDKLSIMSRERVEQYFVDGS